MRVKRAAKNDDERMMMKVKMKMNTKIEMKCGYEDGLGTRSNSV